MARERPTTAEAFLQIKGVGLRKLQELGPRFLACIRAQQVDYADTAPSTP
jgi:superfamily II DNA helicase RecQ